MGNIHVNHIENYVSGWELIFIVVNNDEKQKSLIRPELIKWFKLTANSVHCFCNYVTGEHKGCPQFTLYIKALLILITFQLNLN